MHQDLCARTHSALNPAILVSLVESQLGWGSAARGGWFLLWCCCVQTTLHIVYAMHASALGLLLLVVQTACMALEIQQHCWSFTGQCMLVCVHCACSKH